MVDVRPAFSAAEYVPVTAGPDESVYLRPNALQDSERRSLWHRRQHH